MSTIVSKFRAAAISAVLLVAAVLVMSVVTQTGEAPLPGSQSQASAPTKPLVPEGMVLLRAYWKLAPVRPHAQIRVDIQYQTVVNENAPPKWVDNFHGALWEQLVDYKETDGYLLFTVTNLLQPKGWSRCEIHFPGNRAPIINDGSPTEKAHTVCGIG